MPWWQRLLVGVGLFIGGGVTVLVMLSWAGVGRSTGFDDRALWLLLLHQNPTPGGAEIYMVSDLRADLARSLWPARYHDTVVQITLCESGTDALKVGRKTTFNVAARGDQGLAHGLLQIRVDLHPRVDRIFELDDPVQNLNAGYVVFLEAGKWFGPWSCWTG